MTPLAVDAQARDNDVASLDAHVEHREHIGSSTVVVVLNNISSLEVDVGVHAAVRGPVPLAFCCSSVAIPHLGSGFVLRF